MQGLEGTESDATNKKQIKNTYTNFFIRFTLVGQVCFKCPAFWYTWLLVLSEDEECGGCLLLKVAHKLGHRSVVGQLEVFRTAGLAQLISNVVKIDVTPLIRECFFLNCVLDVAD